MEAIIWENVKKFPYIPPRNQGNVQTRREEEEEERSQYYRTKAKREMGEASFFFWSWRMFFMCSLSHVSLP